MSDTTEQEDRGISSASFLPISAKCELHDSATF